MKYTVSQTDRQTKLDTEELPIYGTSMYYVSVFWGFSDERCSVNFKIKKSRQLFTINFKSKMVISRLEMSTY